MLAIEEALEEVLHALRGIGRAVPGFLPGALGLRLRFPGRALDLLAGDLGAFHHCVADALGPLLYPLAGLLGPGLDLSLCRYYFSGFPGLSLCGFVVLPCR